MIVVTTWMGIEERERNMNKNIDLDTKKGLRKALLAVAEMFEANELVHSSSQVVGLDDINIKPKPDQRNFNLEVTADSDCECGTVACIGGWLWLLNKEKPSATKDGSIIYNYKATNRAIDFVSSRRGKLHELFYPPFELFSADAEEDSEEEAFWRDYVDSYGKITPSQAAKAIRNFVENGDADWFSVMKDAQNALEKE